VRDTVPFIPFKLLVEDEGGNWADGGFLAEREGEDVVEDVPLTPFMDVWIFSGRFNLLIFRGSQTQPATSIRATSSRNPATESLMNAIWPCRKVGLDVLFVR
jgi:hypothetical protein